MKKYFSLLLIIFLLIPFRIYADSISINSQNAVMINLNNNEIIYEKNKDEIIKVASMQKIMTALIAIENIEDLNEQVVLPYGIFDNLDPELAMAGFSSGETVSYYDLLYATLLKSGADGAYALGVLISGSEEEYVNLMNAKAKELNLKNTHFTNTTGLDDDNQYSTVYDMAIILKYALNNKTFKKIISTKEYTTMNELYTFNGPVKKALSLEMNYFLGGKTGYTSLAGLCLASFSKYDDVSYILVTARANEELKDQNFYDQKTLYDYFIDNFSFQTLVKKNDKIKTIKTMYDENVVLRNKRDVNMYIKNSVFQNDLKYEYKGKERLNRGIKKGDKIGKYTIKYNDTILYEEDVLSPITVKFKLKKEMKIVLFVILSSMLIHLKIRSIKRKRKKRKIKHKNNKI